MRRKTVAEVMNPEVLTVQDDMTLEELATFLIDHDISGAPVEDRDGRLVGVVSVMDLASAASEQGSLAKNGDSQPEFFVRSWDDQLEEARIPHLRVTNEGRRVRDVMSREIYSVAEETPLADAAMMMMKGHLHRLLVLRDGRPVGIVSTSDLLSLVAEEAV